MLIVTLASDMSSAETGERAQALFRALIAEAGGRRADAAPGGDPSPDLVAFLSERAGLARAQTVTVTADDPGRHGVLVSFDIVMPGVTSLPILSELSLVTVDATLVVFIAQSLRADEGTEAILRRTGRSLRRGTGR